MKVSLQNDNRGVCKHNRCEDAHGCSKQPYMSTPSVRFASQIGRDAEGNEQLVRYWDGRCVTCGDRAICTEIRGN